MGEPSDIGSLNIALMRALGVPASLTQVTKLALVLKPAAWPTVIVEHEYHDLRDGAALQAVSTEWKLIREAVPAVPWCCGGPMLDVTVAGNASRIWLCSGCGRAVGDNLEPIATPAAQAAAVAPTSPPQPTAPPAAEDAAPLVLSPRELALAQVLRRQCVADVLRLLAQEGR